MREKEEGNSLEMGKRRPPYHNTMPVYNTNHFLFFPHVSGVCVVNEHCSVYSATLFVIFLGAKNHHVAQYT